MFNRNRLFIPVQSNKIRRFDLMSPALPAALSDLDLGSDVEIVSAAMFSNGDLCLLDLGGQLIRVTQAGVITWSVESRDADEAPFQVAVDKLDQVWVGMDGGKLARFDSDGTLLNRLDDTNNPVVQVSNGTFMVAYNPGQGRIVLVDIASGTMAGDFLVADISSQHEPCDVVQIGMLGAKFYLPARRKLTATENPGKYEILEVATDSLLSVLDLAWPRAIRGTLTEVGGAVWAMDEFTCLARFRSDMSIEAVFALESLGRLSAMTLSTDASVLYIVSDDLFGSARVHALDPEVGVSEHVEYSGTPMNGGDLAGYQRATVTEEPDVEGTAPVVDGGLIEALIFPDETVITGKPGAALFATDVSCPVGDAEIEEDGSFAIRGSNMAPDTVTLTFTGPGGDTVQDVSATDHAETVTIATFHGTRFGLGGGQIQISLADGSGPQETGSHFIRIKDLDTGKYWNGSVFVESNGLWLSLSHQDMGLWSYLFDPEKAGDYAVLFQENDVFGYDAVQITSEPEDTTEILSQVKNMAAPGAALLAPSSLFLDETKIGGFLAGRLNRLQFLANILAFKAQVIFPKAIEGISAVVSKTTIKQGDTPLLTFTIMDSVTGQGKDTTGHTVRLRCRAQAGGPLIFDRELTAVDAKTGQYQVRLAAEDTDTAGSFQAELVDTSADGVILTTQNFGFTITRNLG